MLRARGTALVVSSIVVVALLAAPLDATNGAGQAGGSPDVLLDRVFAAYAAGDREIVARTFTGPREFQSRHLNDARAVTRWLGAWQPQKAVFLLDLATATTLVAPAQTWPLLSAGQRYLTERPNRREASAPEQAFERLWHRTALGLLQRNAHVSFEEQYLATLRAGRTPADAPLADNRLLLAHAIAVEQRCWNDRAVFLGAGESSNDVARASGTAESAADSKSSIAGAEARRRTCLTEAALRFDAASAMDEAGAEARVRGAWIRFQLGQFPEALRTLDAAHPGDDRELAYWAALFRGRIDDALERPSDAEHAYRAALDAWPGAQSAGVGLALTLFRMRREADADAAALAVRSRADAVRDPWWTYPGADQRFVADWLARLRAAVP